ncbi:hypothetical protein F5879DRAFT_1002783 [Lentinula edodes]|nr:hypothetical protein F5879DRAFT_1002783 [Lentinula edodes]
MLEPQPSHHVHSPTHEDEYLYGKLTRTQYEILEQRPMEFGINFSNQTFPRPVGAGPRWEEKYSMQTLVAIRDCLLQVDHSDKGKCQVCKAEFQSNKDRRDFGNPWTIILYDISADFRAWLLDLGVVALGEPGATFMVHSLDEGKMSWVLLNFCGPAVEDKEEERVEALVAIKSEIFGNEDVRKAVQVFVGAHKNDPTCPEIMSKTYTQVLDTITSSFCLVYIPRDDKNGVPNPRYQLRGRPISSNKDIQRKWVIVLRSIKYNVCFQPLYPDKGDFGCVWCKHGIPMYMQVGTSLPECSRQQS